MAAPTISSEISANFVSPGILGNSLGNLTIGANTKAVVLVLAASGDPVSPTPLPTVGGVDMAFALDTSVGVIYWLDDPIGAGLSGSENVVIWFNSGGYRAAATAYALDHADAIELRDTTSGSGYADNVPTLYTLPNMSGDTTDAWSVGYAYNNGFFTGNIVLGGDLVEDWDHNIASERIKTYHDTTTPLGGHAYANGTGGTMFMGMAMFGPVVPPDKLFAPTAFGVEVGFQAGLVFGPGADVTILPVAFGLEVGFQSGVRLNAIGPRQVMLTGSDIETPEMTVGGTDGYVLTYHASAAPTWEDSGLGGLGANATHIWRPVMDGYGNVVVDGGTGEAVMAYGPV